MLRDARPIRFAGRIPLIGALLFGTGCHTFRATSVEAVRPGMEVKATLLAGGVETVSALTGERTTSVVGRLERLPADSVVLSMWRTDLITSNFQPGRIEVPLRRDQVAAVEEKRLSRSRTGALLAGLGAGLYLFVRIVWQGVGGGLLDDGGGPGI